MGLFATGSSALGMSLGEEVNVVSDAPGPHSMRAWKPGEGSVACGMLGGLQISTDADAIARFNFSDPRPARGGVLSTQWGVWRAAPPKFRTCNDSFARLSVLGSGCARGAVDAGRGRRVQHDSIATC